MSGALDGSMDATGALLDYLDDHYAVIARLGPGDLINARHGYWIARSSWAKTPIRMTCLNRLAKGASGCPEK
jgi:hypothetical protein